MATDPELKAMEATLSALEPLSADEQQRVLDWLVSKLGLEAPMLRGDGEGLDILGVDGGGIGRLGTIKQFLKGKRPDNDVARAIALGYYLTHALGKETFTAADLSRARTDAALANFNVSRGAANARGSGYLTTTGARGTLKITSVGESLVEAMPDKEAMKKATTQRRRPRRKTASRKRDTPKKRTAKS